MGHYHGNLARVGVVSADDAELPPPMNKTSRLFGNPARSQTLDSKAFDERLNRASAILDRPIPPRSREELLPEFKKPTLRVDAFLGEWLSPDYYEFLAAPPESNMMVAGAKAELLKSAEPIRGAKIIEHDGSVKVFPGADSTPAAQARANRDRGVSFSLDEIARHLPSHAPKAKSVDTTQEQDSTVVSKKEPEKPKRNIGYIPPTPTYALLPKAPIPAGYVAHARDQCTDIDFGWDSMREPQAWGDGGQYGEEWSSMHRRFRSGFSNMVQWYKSHDPDFNPQTGKDVDDDKTLADDSTDTVLVIVTHGAGCNALIGALTNQPVLMDVGMGSLTMAVRAPHSATSPVERQRSNSNAAGYRRRRASSVDMGLHQEYDMKMIASSEHLRAGADPLTIPQLAGGSVNMPSIPESNPTSGSTTPRERAGSFNNKNSALGSMRRTSVKAKSSRAYSPSPVLTSATNSGLWGGSGSTLDNGEALSLSPTPDLSPAQEKTINFSGNGAVAHRQDTAGSESALSLSGDSTPPAAPAAPSAPSAPAPRQGLWGSGPGLGPRGSNRR